MGGNHKKNLRAEKAKVKLKGAKLPKGLNVTKTDFKVRKIIIREQLKSAPQYADGESQLNLKETLSRLKHHNSKSRLEALSNLREAITRCQVGSNLLAQLSEFIQAIVALALDVDRDTRRESFKTLSSLLGALTSGTVAPFFHIISSYLRCAMTHIQPQLQEDALLLLDVLLKHTPNLVAAHSAKIFQNFLEMISRVRAEGDRAGRTLTVHMGQHQTTIKWRSKVLQRLQQMLHTLAEHNRAVSKSSGAGAFSCTYTFNATEPQYYALKRAYGAQQLCDLTGIFCRNSDVSSSATSDGAVAVDEATLLRSYAEHLMPLLLDAWLEVRAPENSGVAQVILSHEAALTLKVVLEIIECLWSLVEIHEQQVKNKDLSDWLRYTYGESFANSFLQLGFPYQQKEQLTATTHKKSKKAGCKDDAGGQYCLPQNVCISHLMCRFNAQHTIDEQRAQKFKVLLQYLNKLLENPRSHALENYAPVAAALRAYLLQNAHEMLQLEETQLGQLLRATIKAFLSNQFASRDAGTGSNSSLSAKVLDLLCDVVQRPQLCEVYGTQVFEQFLQHLPLLLLRPAITEAALISMSHLGKQKNAVFLQALEQQVQPIIENIQRIQVLGASNAFEGKKHIMNLFYWTERGWRNAPEKLEQLAGAVEKHVTDKRIVGYYKCILTQG